MKYKISPSLYQYLEKEGVLANSTNLYIHGLTTRNFITQKQALKKAFKEFISTLDIEQKIFLSGALEISDTYISFEDFKAFKPIETMIVNVFEN